MAKIICGVDVASGLLEVRIGFDGPAHSFPNTAEGIADLATFCRHQNVELVAMEATGGYERQPFSLLWAQGVPVVLLHPQAVRRFAQSMGLLEKTDRMDAAGKPKKVILVARAHKLLVRLNAKAREVRQQLALPATCAT